MGQQRRHQPTKSHTLPSSPTHSSSSSDFEFTISASPRKSSAAALCPADELFYKGQLLPLHLSPRISMVRHLLLSSASTSDTSTTTSRDSTASTSSTSSADLPHHHPDSDSSGRPSSAAPDDEFKRLTSTNNYHQPSRSSSKPSKYFSLPKLSSVFRHKNTAAAPPSSGGAAAVRRVSSSAKEVIRRYLKKVKPLYEKLSQKHKMPPPASPPRSKPPPPPPSSRSAYIPLHPKENTRRNIIPLSFSGNLKLYSMNRGGPRNCISSCPSSMGSSPTHRSGYGFGFGPYQPSRIASNGSDASSMEELQSAIQGAIAHCKNSMNKTMVSNEA